VNRTIRLPLRLPEAQAKAPAEIMEQITASFETIPFEGGWLRDGNACWLHRLTYRDDKAFSSGVRLMLARHKALEALPLSARVLQRS